MDSAGFLVRSLGDGDIPRIHALLQRVGWKERYVQGQLDCVTGFAAGDHARVFVAEGPTGPIGYLTIK